MKAMTAIAMIFATLLVSCASSAHPPSATPDLSKVPADIPIYPAPFNSHYSVSGLSLVYFVNANLQIVARFYQTAMLQQGWTQSDTPVLTDAEIILNYQKTDRNVMIDLLKEKDNVTLVGINIPPLDTPLP